MTDPSNESVLFSWSSGKDSALALRLIQQQQDVDVSALLSVVMDNDQKISMHGITQELLERQVRSLGLPLEKVYLTPGAPNQEYESMMRDVLTRYSGKGVKRVVFGDISLTDLREYRENQLARIGMKAMFPLWGEDTPGLAERFIEYGFKAVVTCVDTHVLGKTFVGRIFDTAFLNDLPPDVDPCGENGEFHTFVFDGPLFREKIPFRQGNIVTEDNRFYLLNLF